jgi:hypothetical protein
VSSKPSIASAELKAQWAKVHLDALEARIKKFVEDEAKPPSGEDDIASGEHVITLWATDPPVEAGLIMGDFICCLRSALDHLAYALASINGKPTRDTHFPIKHKDTAETHLAIAKATIGFPDEAITLIGHIQPYHHTDYKLRHLWRLHKLWNIDKHYFIAMHSIALQWQIPSELVQPTSVNRFDDHVDMRFPLSVKENMHLYPRPMIDVQFGNDEQGITVGFKDFAGMYQYVAEGVIPMFKGYFRQ